MTRSPILALAVLLLAGAPTLAQERVAAPGQPAKFDDDLRARFVAQAPDDIVASKLIGLSIRNGANETIGSVADVAFDEKRTIKSYVVSVGGFLGLNAKYVAIAPDTLRLTRKDDKTLDAVIETDKDQLRAAPEYVYLGAEPKR